jgi:hypothetical protein
MAVDSAIRQSQDEKSRLAFDELVEAVAMEKTEDAAIDLTLPAEEIIAKYAPDASEETIALVKALLAKLQPAADDEPPGAAPVKPEEIPAKDDDPRYEAVITALKTISPDDLRSAFWGLEDMANKARGKEILDKLVAALQGAAPGDEALENPMKEEPSKMKQEQPLAQDADTIRAQVEKTVIGRVRALNAAAADCRFAVGNQLDPLAFDSAEDIYAKALSLSGVDIKAYPREAYKGMVDVLKKNKNIVTAKDSALLPPDENIEKHLQYLDSIEVL